jgi:hypothetical protein
MAGEIDILGMAVHAEKAAHGWTTRKGVSPYDWRRPFSEIQIVATESFEYVSQVLQGIVDVRREIWDDFGIIV